MKIDRRAVLAAQGGYYLATGVAPFVSRPAFEKVTGPKSEWWLVQTVGLLAGTIGGGLLAAAVRDRVTPEITGIAVGSALSFAAIDTVYALRGRIAPTYLADAAAQAAITGAIAAGSR